MLGHSALSERALSELKAAATGNTNVLTGAGALTLTGFAPTVAVSNNQTVLSGTGQLVLTGAAPTLGAGIATDVGALTLTGFAPAVMASANQTVPTGAGALVLTGFAPTATTTANQTVVTDVGALVLTGFSPTVGVGGPQTVATDIGALLLTGYAPTVAVSSSVVPVPPSVGTGPRIPFAKQRRIKVTERDILRTRKRHVVVVEDATPERVVIVAGVPLPVPEAAPPSYPVGESATIALQPKPYVAPKAEPFVAPEPWSPPEPEPHWLTDDDVDTLIYALA